MKKLLFITFCTLWILLTNAQSQNSFNYQAVIRDGDGEILSNQLVSIQIAILQESSDGPIVYKETFNVNTTTFGLINLKVGNGSAIEGAFELIEWGDGPFFIETSIDRNGGSAFVILGTSQLLSVPFALYAQSSGDSKPGPKGDSGLDGKTLLNGTITPSSEGNEGDFYINTSTNHIYGPKTSGFWGDGTSLVGANGAAGADGQDGADGMDGTNGADGLDGMNGANGKTILNGTVAPTTEDDDGDFYFNTATNEIHGPKIAGAWGTGTSLIGATGATGAEGAEGADGQNGADGVAGTNGADGLAGVDGANGKTILNGTMAPTTEGEDGDFYFNTATSEIHGPKIAGAWGTGTSLIGATGAAGADGQDGADGVAGTNGADGVDGANGKTILNGTVAPTTEGDDGDFYFNTATSEIHGPKIGGAWGTGASLIGATGADGQDGTNGMDGTNGVDGLDGRTILNGTVTPTTEGAEGDFYLNTATSELFGPKVSSAWGPATALIGASGSDGSDGADGNTVLNGTVAPTIEGADGDFYVNTATNEIHGPRVSGVWGAGTSLVGINGLDGTDGLDGRTILNGAVAPTTEGEDGDFYLNTATSELFGPKVSSAWGPATALIGATGSDGSDGADGNTVLNGTVAPTTEGADGDFYLNTVTNEIHGPKTAGVWGVGSSLIGATGPQGPAGSGGGTAATYRWASFNTYSNGLNQWAYNNDASFFGGVQPSLWTDANALASDMSSDKEVLRTLFVNKGYASKNAMIFNDELASFSSTNGRVGIILMRIQNTTSAAIDWSPHIIYSCYGAWGERASAALNGVSLMNESVSGDQTISSISIPASRISTFIVVTTSSNPAGTPGIRTFRLGFLSESLDLPAGLEFVDDLDTATGGWEQ